MAELLYVGTYRTDDPNRATMPLIGAVGTLKRGHDPSIVPMGEAVDMLRGKALHTVQGVGLPLMRALVDRVVESRVALHVRLPCAGAREVSESDFDRMNARLAGADDLADPMAAPDRVSSF